MNDDEMKAECDRIAGKLLDVLQAEAGDMPRAVVLGIILGAGAALAYACKQPREVALGMVSAAYDDIEAGS